MRTRGWEALDSIVLADEFRVQVRCVQGVPAFLRGQLRGAFRTSLARLREAYGHQDEPNKVRSWKLFRLTSRMLLWRSHARSPSREELEKRLERFHNQEWLTLIREAREAGSADRRPRRRRISEAEELELRALRAEKAVRRAEVSTGRQALCSAAVVSGNAETLRKLRDPERRPAWSPLPAEALAFTPPTPTRFRRGALREQRAERAARCRRRSGRRHQRAPEDSLGRRGGHGPLGLRGAKARRRRCARRDRRRSTAGGLDSARQGRRPRQRDRGWRHFPQRRRTHVGPAARGGL